MPVELPDIVYPVRAGDSNEELRFSLRCLHANLPHATVWVVGYQPAWVTGVKFIPGNRQPGERANVYHNILLAMQHPEVAERVVVMNDDFFITAPVDEVPVMFRGTLRDHMKLPRVRAGINWWRESLASTWRTLQGEGITDPISYELHVPFPVDKVKMRDTLERCAHVQPRNPPQWRTLYGNMHGIGGVKQFDGKSSRPGPIHTPYHSTTDASWRHFKDRFTVLYPAPSPYEADAAR